MTHSVPKGPCDGEEFMERSQNSSNPFLSWPQALQSILHNALFDIFALET